MDIGLYSFDIFDTLITRKTATCNGIFALMQDELIENASYEDIPEHLRKNFLLLRKQCEMVARNTYVNAAVRDVTLSQIYQCIESTMGLSRSQAERLEQLEIMTEYDNCIAIDENIDKVVNYVKEGRRVVLVSNMYLSEAVIRKMLVKHNHVFENITMYVSCECGKTKGTWTLYQYVREKENILFHEWRHFGDNPKLDIDIPKALGIQAEQCRVPEGMPWEKYYLEEKEDNLALQIAVAPSLVLQRQRANSYSYLVGSSYSAPVLYPYVKWILEQSVQRGITCLYFIARDGYALKKMADCIIREEGIEIQSEYLYGSRKAWRLPSIQPDNFDMKEFLKWNYPGQVFSYQKIADMFEISMAELRQFLPFAAEDAELTPGFIHKVYAFMEDNQGAIAEYVAEKQTENRKNAVAYLHQELGKAKGKYAFVDLIGSGYTQKCLADLLDIPERLITFFYRLDSCKEYQSNVNYAFYPNRQKLGNIIEVLCNAEHGKTVGYQVKEGVWEPILCKGEEEFLEAYGYKDYQQGILEYTQARVQMQTCGKDRAVLDVPQYYFSFLADVKDEKLYEYIMDMPYEISNKEEQIQSFAPRLSGNTLRKIYWTHADERDRKYYNGYSLEFSLLRLSEAQRKRVECYKKINQTKFGGWVRKLAQKRSAQKSSSHDYDLIADKIVIYGAGKKGQLLYDQLTKGKCYHAEVLLWVDRNYAEYNKNGLMVSAVEEIYNVSYEQIVIAINAEPLALEIKKELVERGILPYKIIWIRPDAQVK